MTPMTRSPTIIGAQIHPRMRALPCTSLAKCGFCETSAKTCGRFERTTWTLRLVSSSRSKPTPRRPLEIVEAAPAHDHQAVALDHLHGTAVVGHDPLQLAEDRLDRVLEAQRLPEHLRHGQERLSVLACALELGDVVVDRVEADVLAVGGERHEHHLHVDQLPVLPDATSDPVGTTSLEGLVGDVPAFSAEILVEDEVVDQPSDRILRRPPEELRRGRVPARHPLVGVHHDDRHRADLDERLEVLLLAADLGERTQALERGADVLRDVRQQVAIGVGVADGGGVGLHRQDAHHPPTRFERDADPFVVVGDGPDHVDLTALDQPFPVRRPEQLRFAGPQHVGRGATRVADAERIPHVRVGDLVVELVDVVGRVDAAARSSS